MNSTTDHKAWMIFGAHGQLGAALMEALDDRPIADDDESALRRVVLADIETCDITEPGAVKRFVDEHRPLSVVFNAAAYTAVDAAESDPEQARAVNAAGAEAVARAAASARARLLHFSTDFVFGNGHQKPIDEADAPRPLSIYGATKWEGEQRARIAHRHTAILRTSGLYHQSGQNFIASIIGAALTRHRLEVVDDQIVSPTPATELADLAIRLATSPLFDAGVYHATCQGSCSWYEVACAIVDHLDLEVEVEPIATEDRPSPARRPSYSVLRNRRLQELGLDDFSHWRDALFDYLDDHGDALIARARGDKPSSSRRPSSPGRDNH